MSDLAQLVKDLKREAIVAWMRETHDGWFDGKLQYSDSGDTFRWFDWAGVEYNVTKPDQAGEGGGVSTATFHLRLDPNAPPKKESSDEYVKLFQDFRDYIDKMFRFHIRDGSWLDLPDPSSGFDECYDRIQEVASILFPYGDNVMRFLMEGVDKAVPKNGCDGDVVVWVRRVVDELIVVVESNFVLACVLAWRVRDLKEIWSSARAKLEANIVKCINECKRIQAPAWGEDDTLAVARIFATALSAIPPTSVIGAGLAVATTPEWGMTISDEGDWSSGGDGSFNEKSKVWESVKQLGRHIGNPDKPYDYSLYEVIEEAEGRIKESLEKLLGRMSCENPEFFLDRNVDDQANSRGKEFSTDDLALVDRNFQLIADELVQFVTDLRTVINEYKFIWARPKGLGVTVSDEEYGCFESFTGVLNSLERGFTAIEGETTTDKLQNMAKAVSSYANYNEAIEDNCTIR